MKQEPASPRPAGKTTIAPDVLNTIARLAALEVPGVARTCAGPGVHRLRKAADDGVRVLVRDHTVTVDLYLVVQPDQNVRQVGRAVQAAVNRAIVEMLGMDVAAVNVHVEDVENPAQAAP
jgi:uncharacterized alkaline shock family protein YloU